jgi:integrase
MDGSARAGGGAQGDHRPALPRSGAPPPVAPLGHLRLDQLTPARIARWRDEQIAGANTRTSEPGIAPTFVAQSYRVLRACLSAAVREGHLATNPCTIPGASTARPLREKRLLTQDEIEALTAAIPARYRALLVVLAWTGLRFGEAAALTRSNLHLDQGYISVRRRVVHLSGHGADVDTPKSGAGVRDVYLPAFVTAELERHLARFSPNHPDALVFPAATGGYLRHDSFAQALRRTCERLGMEAHPRTLATRLCRHHRGPARGHSRRNNAPTRPFHSERRHGLPARF